MTPEGFTAAACRSAADEWARSTSQAQRAFAPTLRQWADNAARRTTPKEMQGDLFDTTRNDASHL